jgi:hypothetical protein
LSTTDRTFSNHFAVALIFGIFFTEENPYAGNELKRARLPLLKENEKLFGIQIEDLLKVDGVIRRPECVYRKVVPVEVAALAKYESGI